ncbi:MAG: hypothetical protein GEU28_03465 [Dehalococcoidia bacterium]|nr:hypothetical protein [Dehalococcoidia bacterium]
MPHYSPVRLGRCPAHECKGGTDQVNRLYLPRHSALPNRRLSRRSLLRGTAIGGAGLAAAAFVGCGDDDDDDDDDTPAEATEAEATEEVAEGTAEAAAPEETDEEEEEPSGELENVTFAFSFPAPHAGLLCLHYVAQEMGYFEEEGIIEEISYQTAVTPLLAGGTVDYAEASPDEILNAYAAGQELKSLYQPLYGFFFGVVVPADSDIQEFTAETVQGQAIGITELAGGEVPALRAMIASIGLDSNTDVELVPTSGSSQAITVDAFNTGRIQFMAASLLDFAAIEVTGFALRNITPPVVVDLQADNSVSVRADWLEEEGNREQAVRFCRAEAKAKVFTRENPDAAVELALRVAPDTGSFEEVRDFVEITTISRLDPPEGIQDGEPPLEGWRAYQDFLLAGSTGGEADPLAFTEPQPVEELVDLTLIDEILDFDEEPILQQARDFQA